MQSKVIAENKHKNKDVKKIYTRRCLRCDKKFETENPYYRLCPSCRRTATENNYWT